MLNRYSAGLAWSDEDGGYVATSVEFPGLSGVAADPLAALRELDEAIDMALDVLREAGETLPAPRRLSSYSGQFRLRVPRTLHQMLAGAADANGVSLNTLAVSLLSQGLAQHDAQTNPSRSRARRAL